MRRHHARVKPTLPGLRRPVLAALVLVVASTATAAAQEPRTRAERTDYLETSRYEDVLAFIDAIADAPVLHPTHFGYSYQGRRLPLVVVARGLADATPEAVRATGRTRVLVFANIHAGEVEGKEAAQVLLRSFANGEREAWLDSLVVLIAPIYNADGNEAVAVMNRARQNGPLSGVGTRHNAQGLDLNRDHVKLESPEARSLVALIREWDPHVVVDLHTTNGTRHAYHLTYSPPLNPNTAPTIVDFLRDRWLPEVTRRIRDQHGWHLHYYGNAYDPGVGEVGWVTFDHRPRFNNNYVGLRNRFAILSEAYSYASFRDRVAVTLAFVEEILAFAARHAGEIRRRVAAAEAESPVGGRLALRADLERGPLVEILMGEVEERLSHISGRRYLERTDVVEPVRMPEYGTFRPAERERVPEEYYVPAELTAVVDLLALHGVRTIALAEAQVLDLERFVIDSTRLAEREFEGHHERELFGRWVAVRDTLPRGTLVVPVAGQPLARLAFYLLEPRSDDGVVAWNVVDGALEETPDHYAILRLPAAAEPRPAWQPRGPPTEAEFRGLAAAPGGVAWAGGRNGIWARTIDGGEHWVTGTVPGADSLFLVDVHAVDASEAYVLATHFDGGLARIYQTTDGGAHWRAVFEDRRPGAFYDGLAFWDDRRGVAFGDAIDGRMTIVYTMDGRRWVPAERVPQALEGEGGFAASGTAIVTAGRRHAWIGTGAGERARVLRTDDGGRTWTAAEAPLPAGPTAGIFGVAFRDTLNGVAVGGDYTDTTGVARNVLRTRDGGRSWELVGRSAPAGVRWGVAYVPGSRPPMLVAVGPAGSGYSLDDGSTWTRIDRTGFNTVAFSGPREGWAAGVRGLVARLR